MVLESMPLIRVLLVVLAVRKGPRLSVCLLAALLGHLAVVLVVMAQASMMPG